MHLVTLDFETFYDPKDGYDLKKMSMADYVTDPRFRVLNVAIKVDQKPAENFGHPKQILDAIRTTLDKCGVLAHHAHFEAAILSWHFGIRPVHWFDTLSMANVLGLNVEAGGGSLEKLKAWAGLGAKKPLAPDSSPAERAARAIDDVEDTYTIFGKMVRLVPNIELRLIDWTIRRFSQPILKLDVPRTRTLIETLEKRKAEQMEELGVTREMLNSDEQFAGLLRDLGVEDIPRKPSPSNPEIWKYAFAKTDKGMLELLEDEDPRVQALAAARIDAKSTGDQTRAERLIRTYGRLGALPVYLKHYGAHTGRWSGGDNTNWQNFSKVRKDAKGEYVPGTGEIRKSIVAPPGMVIVAGDAKQIEARGTAWVCGQRDLVWDFRDGVDIYCKMASDIFNKTVNPKMTFERFLGKQTVLGCGFGVGHKKFRDTARKIGRVEITEATARKSVYTFREKYFKIPQGWNLCEALLGNPGHRFGPVVSEGDKLLFPDGTRIVYHELQKGRDGWSVLTKKGRRGIWGGYILENIVQKLARIIVAEALLEIEAHWPCPTMTHDEIIAVVPEEDAMKAKQVFEDQLSRGPAWIEGFEGFDQPWPLAAEVGFHRVYGEIE